ncbi:MAG: hypothetical protein F9K18_12075 [Thermoanaerobaculia bacterium]|nr:MAG: hypothetical protein F9K18_12075 [Thermoanaerobaculia bacterium]
MPGPASQAIERVASRMKFPQVFSVLLVLFVIDFLVPDLIPFVDEILLGLGTVAFGLWREKLAPPEAPKPPEKNVTPQG